MIGRQLLILMFIVSRFLSSGSNKFQRIERIISNRGAGSRNEVAKLIAQGRIQDSEGKVIRSGADKLNIEARIFVDGEELLSTPLLACYHKPLGVHSVMGEDKWGRENLEALSESFPFLKSMHPVGRLDADTTGLLLFSSDGQLTQLLLHPSTGIVREYEAVVAEEVQHEQLLSTLRSGVNTTDGVFPADLLESRIINKVLRPQKPPLTSSTVEGDLEEFLESMEDSDLLPPREVSTSFVRVGVAEGKYRMVRRILHNAGHSVLQLHRIRYGDIRLEDLEVGNVRRCTETEAEWGRNLLVKYNKLKK